MKTPLHPVGDWQAMEPVAAAKEIQKKQAGWDISPQPSEGAKVPRHRQASKPKPKNGGFGNGRGL